MLAHLKALQLRRSYKTFKIISILRRCKDLFWKNEIKSMKKKYLIVNSDYKNGGI